MYLILSVTYYYLSKAPAAKDTRGRLGRRRREMHACGGGGGGRPVFPTLTCWYLTAGGEQEQAEAEAARKRAENEKLREEMNRDMVGACPP